MTAKHFNIFHEWSPDFSNLTCLTGWRKTVRGHRPEHTATDTYVTGRTNKEKVRRRQERERGGRERGRERERRKRVEREEGERKRE